MKKVLSALSVCLMIGGAVQAAAVTVLSFSGLNNVDGISNALRVDGSATGLSISRAVEGNDTLFAVTYTGADYNGDASNDTLTYTLRVAGFSGGSIVSGLAANSAAGIFNTGSATIGTTSEAVVERALLGDFPGFSVGDTSMNDGESLKFSVENILVKNSGGTVIGTGAFDGFNAVIAREGTGHSHVTVVGVGSDLAVAEYNLLQAFSTSDLDTLYVSSTAPLGGSSQPQNWGVQDVDYGITVTTDEVPPSPTVAGWTGAVDSNWNIAGNWDSGLVPGSATVEIAVLAGTSDTPVVATPIEATNSFSIKMGSEALLTISREMARCVDLLLGVTAGSGGGHVIQDANVTVADDLRIGDDAAATSDSSYRVINGALAVANQLYIDQGILSIESSTTSLAAGRMALTANACIKFDFDAYGTSPIVVSNALTIADGATLEVDLRGYTMGGNEIELIQFGSISGTFDSADVTIIGLDGGTLSYGANTLTLTVVDSVQDPVSTLWFKAEPGTADAADLEVNTGRIIRNLSSTALTYTKATDGDDLVYSITWAGSDFDRDSSNDTISFDLRAEGFSGSTYTYSTTSGASSVTVGSSATVTADSEKWGIGTDMDLDAGEGLRFSVESVSLSASGYTATVDGFVAINFDEVSGHSHQIIIGEGSGLDSFISNTPVDYALNAITPVTATSAGSALAPALYISSVALKISVTNPSNPNPEMDASDYSAYSTGPQMGLDYSAETTFLNYPEFSWDRVQRWGNANDVYSTTVAQSMAAHYQILAVNGWDTEDENIADATLLKQYNPNLKTLFYLNTSINFETLNADAFYDADEWNSFTLDANGDRVYDKIRYYDKYNHDYPEMSEWWVDVVASMVAHSEIDGVFIDKADTDGSFINKEGQYESPVSGSSRSYYDLWSQVPAGTLVIGNALRNEREGGNRASMQLFSGSYIERWTLPDGGSPIAQTAAEAKCVSIQLMREAALKGKILMPAFPDRLTADELGLGETELIALIRERVTLPLAYYLIVAEQYSYFRYQPNKDTGYPEYVWDPTDYVDELTRPLGAPLGPPVKNGYIYTRSFEHVDVWLNVETDEAVLVWDSVDSDADGMPDLWEYRNFGDATNAVSVANPDGDAYTNVEEYTAGLNPNVFDTFAVSNFTAGTSNTFEWNMASGRVYNVYWSSNLLDGFSLIESNALGGALIDTNHAGEPSGFYKITVEIE